MRVLILLAILMVSTAFGRIPKRDVVLSDLVLEDCRDKESMETAKERLEGRNIKVGRGDRKIRALCEQLKGNEARRSHRKSPKRQKALQERRALRPPLVGTFSFCNHYKSLQRLAERYGLSYRAVINTCFSYKMQALLASNSHDLSSEGRKFLAHASGSSIGRILH